MIVLLAMLGVARADCVRTTTNSEVEEQLKGALLALQGGNADAFGDQIALVGLALECLEEPVTPELAAGFHRMRGIVDYAAGDATVAASHFLAARRFQPDAPLPVYPEAHDIQRVYLQGVPADGSRPGGPDGQALYVDGVEDGVVDPQAAHLLQVATDGPSFHLLSLAPGQIPPWVEPPSPTGLTLSPVLKGVGAGLLGAGIGLFAANLRTVASFRNRTKDHDLATLENKRRLANGLAVGALVSGLAGGGLLIGGSVMR